ncbi:putative DNA modification/repair radical SAM protein, partial [Mesorhizobium sp. M7A.F.Ca.CA.004.04.2.1]
MSALTVREKLAILSDAAKYDASCASSGAAKKDSLKSGGIGSTEGMGICHSYAPDGRCISLLKVLLTNFCIYDCSYCINRSSSNVRRARFTVDEVVKLTMDFYRRNYIEGLFLSSGVVRSPDETMGEMVEVARRLRVEEKFSGYIHLKTIPESSAELVEKAGLYADRLSINVELPTDEGVKRLAPEKKPETIRLSMARLRQKMEEKAEPTLKTRKRERFAPGGQSTQMIIGADKTSDDGILHTSARLYG